jgi:hypothetical protein
MSKRRRRREKTMALVDCATGYVIDLRENFVTSTEDVNIKAGLWKLVPCPVEMRKSVTARRCYEMGGVLKMRSEAEWPKREAIPELEE